MSGVDCRARADVLVIGGGTSGGIVAKQLADDGFAVVCLEQGDWVSREELPGDKPEFELMARKRWSSDPNIRSLPEDYPCEVSESVAAMKMYNGVGGSSILYGGCWSRLLPSDFRVRTLDGVADDWPLSYEELLPFYEETDQEMSVSGARGDPAYPPDSGFPLPMHPLNRSALKAIEGLDRLGWHWWPGPMSIASRPHRNLERCARFGTCRIGCPAGAKATTDVTHWAEAVRRGARLITRARVREVTVDRRGMATGAIYLDAEGNEHFQAASVVVMAANAIGTARLLLLSRSALFPDGLANSSGLVGRRLMIHPYARVVGIFEEELADWMGPAGQPVQSMEFYETDASRGYVRGCKWLLMPTGGPLDMVARYESGAPELYQWGDTFHQNMKESVGHMLQWTVIPEDLPEEDNRVLLDGELTDSDGIPAPKIVYRTSENTRLMLDFHIQRATEALEAAGATKTWLSGRSYASGHMLGTAVMGDDPARSVVDRFGRSHDVENLYIVDGSVFVTSSGVNPTSTICALARRCGRHIARTAGMQRVAG